VDFEALFAVILIKKGGIKEGITLAARISFWSEKEIRGHYRAVPASSIFISRIS